MIEDRLSVNACLRAKITFLKISSVDFLPVLKPVTRKLGMEEDRASCLVLSDHDSFSGVQPLLKLTEVPTSRKESGRVSAVG